MSLTHLRRALSDATRWRILNALLQEGPMATEFIAKAARISMQNASRHLVFMKNAGILERRMARLYGIPAGFLVPGERALDFGPVVIRFDQGAEDH